MKLVVILLIVSVLAIGLTVAILLNNGGDIATSTNEPTSIDDINKETSSDSDISNPEENTGTSEVTGSGGGGSGGGGGSSDSGDAPRELECETQYIQYSLKKFQENINCEETIGGKCTRLRAICSVEIYNLDVNVDGNFEIKYILEDSNKQEINSTLIQKNVNIETPEILLADFIIVDINGIDTESTCKLTVENVPEKTTCY